MIPVSLSLKDKKVLIVGGGKVALRKVKLFLNEKANITLISSSIIDELYKYPIDIIKKEISEEDVKDYFLVYLATNNEEINHHYTLYCKEYSILCGSATYDENASFYSMGYIENDLGLIALSTHQKLPYHKPLLKKLLSSLDEEREKIQLLSQLRNYIIAHSLYSRQCFELLYECELSFIKFLLSSIDNKSYLFVYHHSDYKQNDPFKLQPHYMLDLKQLEYYQEVLKMFPLIQIVPLVLTKGKIYHRMIDVLKTHQYHQVIDIKELIQLFVSNKKQIFFVHPTKNNILKNQISNISKEYLVYEFNEEMHLNKDEAYQIYVLSFTHGQHYHDMKEYIKQYQDYDIDYYGCLLDKDEVVKYIEDNLSGGV